MPQIIVAADRGAAFGEGAVTFRETVNVADFESQHFATQLVERIGWAVEDANQVEQISASPEDLAGGRKPRRIAQERRSEPIAEQRRPEEIAERRQPQPIAEQRQPKPIADESRPRQIAEATGPRRDERVIVQSPA
jgi:hypothetical protein